MSTAEQILAAGVAGHITARDPELTDHFWVNPFGTSFKQITVSDLILVDPHGVVVEGRRPVNAAAFAIHADSGGAVVTGAEDGAGLAASLADKKVLIHKKHGLITVGDSVEAAAWWFIALERCCQVQAIAEAAGSISVIPDEYAAKSYEQTGHDLGGRFQLQPHVQDLITEQGDTFPTS